MNLGRFVLEPSDRNGTKSVAISNRQAFHFYKTAYAAQTSIARQLRLASFFVLGISVQGKITVDN